MLTMKTIRIVFLIVLPALSAIGYALAGGLGLIAVGVLGFRWRVAPYRLHEPRPDFATSGGAFAVTFVQTAVAQARSIPRPSGSLRLFLDIVVCLMLVMLGVHENLAEQRGVY